MRLPLIQFITGDVDPSDVDAGIIWAELIDNKISVQNAESFDLHGSRDFIECEVEIADLKMDGFVPLLFFQFPEFRTHFYLGFFGNQIVDYDLSFR